MQKNIIFVLVLLLAGCSEDDKGTNNDDGGGTTQVGSVGYESWPSLTSGRSDVYFVVDDTSATDKDGIYSASTSNPIKEILVEGKGYYSPTMSPSKDTIAFLLLSKLRYYDVNNSQLINPGLSINLANIVFINNDYLIGLFSGSIYLVSRATNSTKYIGEGTDLTFYKTDTAICIKKIDNYNYEVNKVSLQPVIGEEPLITFSPIHTIGTNDVITMLSVETSSNRIAYHLLRTDGYYIYTSQIGSSVFNYITKSNYAFALMVNYDKLIYVGEDRLLYVTDFTGSYHTLFRGAE